MRYILFVVAFCVFIDKYNVAGYGRCKRGIQICTVTNETGIPTPVKYEGCVKLCCGGEIYDRDAYVECCGNTSVGIPYNPITQLCCSWPMGGELEIHDKENNGSNTCCGSSLFPKDLIGTHSCCNGDKNRPEVFNHLTEMCCGGVRAFANNTAYTSCCGETSYDRRVSSCPCHDGVVGLKIPETHARCCYSDDGQISNAYNFMTEMCCNGATYNAGSQFCCAGQVGEHRDQVCCDGSIVAKSSEFSGSLAGCCVLEDGTTSVYDTTASVCCGKTIIARNSTLEGEAICCGDVLYDVEEDGDACCEDTPYKREDSICCDGSLFTGNECCNGEGYSSDGQICCSGRITAHNFERPGCCVNQTFDSDSETCCGDTIFDNPMLTNEENEFELSRHTRCCGDFQDSSKLAPYDYRTQTCCAGKISNLNGLPWDSAQCCGEDVVDNELFTCCGGARAENVYGVASVCCGSDVINGTSDICCNGVPLPRTANSENEICCGSALMNPTEEICCNGVPRSLNGVLPEKAICCGDGCIDSTTYWCCNGKQFQKGSDVGVEVSDLLCGDLFP